MLGVAGGHFLTAEDLVGGAGDSCRFEQAAEVWSVGGADGQSAAAGEDVLPGLRFEFCPKFAGAFQDGVVGRVAAVNHAEEPGVSACGAACVCRGVRFESHYGVGESRGLPEAMLPILPKPMTASFPSMVRGPA